MCHLKDLLSKNTIIYLTGILFSTACLCLFYIAWKAPTFPDDSTRLPVKVIDRAKGIKEKDKQFQVYDSLKNVLISILKQKQDDITLQCYLSYTYILLNKIDSAKKILAEYIKINPTSPGLYDMLGYAYYSENNLKEAENYYLQAYKLDPNDIDANKFLKLIKNKQ